MKISKTAVSPTGAVPRANETVLMLVTVMLLLQLCLELGERCRPRLGVLAHPAVVDEPDRDRVQVVQLLPAAFARDHETGPLQHLEVLHHPEPRHRHALLQGGQSLTVLGEERIEKVTPGRVCESLEHLIHGLDIR